MMSPVFKKLSQAVCLCLAATYVLLASGLFAQQTGITAKDWKTTDHYPEPNQTRLKTRITGKEAKAPPNGGALLAMKALKIETFPETGPVAPEMIVEAPQCVVNSDTRLVSSDGPLEIHSGDGKMRIEGEGFLWLAKTNSILIISNKVHTIIERELLAKSTDTNQSSAKTTASVTNAPSGTNQPLHIYSDHFNFDRQANLITYTNNVRVEDIQMILTCDVMTIQRTTAGKIENINADRNVVIINKSTGGRTTGDHAVYTTKDGTQLVELTGNPRWQEGLREGTAQLFIFDRAHNTLRAEGNAYLKIPREAINQSGISLLAQTTPTNTPASTNKFVEVFSDSMLFQMPPTNGPIQTINADKNVVILDPENKSRATGNHAFYSEITGQLELTGHAAWQADQRLAKGDILIFDRTNKAFSARTNAYFKFPVNALGASNDKPSKNNTNQFAEILCDHYDYQNDLLTFHDRVEANFLNGTNTLGTLDCNTLKIAYRSNQVHNIRAETDVYAHQLPIPDLHGTSVEKELVCDTLNIQMRTNSLIQQIVAERNVVAIKTEIRTNSPKPMKLTLNSEVMTVDFLPNTNAVDLLVADRNVLITRNEAIASGARAVYTGTNAIATLTGNPMIVFTNSTLTTKDVLTLDLRNNKLLTRNYKMLPNPETNHTGVVKHSLKPVTTLKKHKR
ncbi:MAG: hypothetical protein JWQ71_43 [Pedosphaera sp.]|nr:hypothetical protein [Pedosphaera sp.]